MKGIFRKTLTVGSFTAVSRILGFVREMLQSRFIGAGVEQSAFTLAFAIPNMARKLFGEGALTAAFVPVFREEIEEVGLQKASRLARAVMTTVMLALGCAATLIVLALVTTQSLADTFELTDRTRLTLHLVTILTPYMIGICGAAFGMGVLNALDRFKASSFMPAFLNIIWIASLASLTFFPGLSTFGRIRIVCWSILGGGFLQMAFMFHCMRKAGVSPRPLFGGFGDGKVRLVWRNLGIAAFGAGAVQINYMLDQALAQAASPWAAGVIGYAERLMDLPLGIIGVAFGTVLLPTFAKCFSRNDANEARDTLVSSVKTMTFVMLPAAVGLCVLAPEVTSVIYQGGKFDSIATTRVARALAVYSTGLVFFGLQKSLTPWFQAQKDMKTPVRISVVTIILNATLNVLSIAMLPVEWRHVGLAASTVICGMLGCQLLVVAAQRKNGSFGFARETPFFVKTAVASAAMGIVVVLLRRHLALAPTLSLTVTIAAGIFVYAATSLSLMRGEVKKRLMSIRRRRDK